ncbi:pyrimidine dimer DNA glycosylase/endonuclease V [Corynebacterium parakroppenstedtii]|uniref:pyrimidine dimer DNA glycosylase/endonuclease V n=1 Tax=Corynebacterium parakroppenstedtii TaxID=2828363 RepID=UPI001C8D9787|nr:pyrimidine dimer DNA glycosylase/endonuclease V [Corynebacterium parakroppenstedtii]MBY0787633.1 DNA lyase [Corynebacterium parakroppenstedtii]
MRIWSLHPRLLDRRGLVACWRETLLAQKVLRGLTKGYTNHPQLERFKATDNPVLSVGSYLHGLADEAVSRGYNFNRDRITYSLDDIAQTAQAQSLIPVTIGQLRYELSFLGTKVANRDPEWLSSTLNSYLEPTDSDENQVIPPAHPLFGVIEGPIESWEKVKDI